MDSAQVNQYVASLGFCPLTEGVGALLADETMVVEGTILLDSTPAITNVVAPGGKMTSTMV